MFANLCSGVNLQSQHLYWTHLVLVHESPESIYIFFTPCSWLVRTYKNHTIMLVIMMSPRISNAQPTMATICGRKRRKVQHQETKGQTKMHLKGHELLRVLKIELPHELLRELIQRAELPPRNQPQLHNLFFYLKKTCRKTKKEGYHLLPRLRLRL